MGSGMEMAVGIDARVVPVVEPSDHIELEEKEVIGAWNSILSKFKTIN